MKTSVDPDQFASLQTRWSRSTLFSKREYKIKKIYRFLYQFSGIREKKIVLPVINILARSCKHRWYLWKLKLEKNVGYTLCSTYHTY